MKSFKMANKTKEEAERHIKEVSIGVSAAMLVACFTVLNESINFQISSETPNLVSIGYAIVALVTAFLAIDIYLLFFHKIDGVQTIKEKNSLTFRILAWILAIFGLFFIFGGKKLCIFQKEINLLWFLLAGLIMAFRYLRYNQNKTQSNK